MKNPTATIAQHMTFIEFLEIYDTPNRVVLLDIDPKALLPLGSIKRKESGSDDTLLHSNATALATLLSFLEKHTVDISWRMRSTSMDEDSSAVFARSLKRSANDTTGSKAIKVESVTRLDTSKAPVSVVFVTYEHSVSALAQAQRALVITQDVRLRWIQEVKGIDRKAPSGYSVTQDVLSELGKLNIALPEESRFLMVSHDVFADKKESIETKKHGFLSFMNDVRFRVLVESPVTHYRSFTPHEYSIHELYRKVVEYIHVFSIADTMERLMVQKSIAQWAWRLKMSMCSLTFGKDLTSTGHMPIYYVAHVTVKQSNRHRTMAMHDLFWSIVPEEWLSAEQIQECQRTHVPMHRLGERCFYGYNTFGMLLMELREEIRNGSLEHAGNRIVVPIPQSCTKFDENYHLVPYTKSFAIPLNKDIILSSTELTGRVSKLRAAEKKSEDPVGFMKLVQEDGTHLGYAPAHFRSDRAIVTEAVKQNGYALRFADAMLKADPVIVGIAVNNHGHDVRALRYAVPVLQEKLVASLAEKNPEVVLYVASTVLQKTALRQRLNSLSPRVSQYVSQVLGTGSNIAPVEGMRLKSQLKSDSRNQQKPRELRVCVIGSRSFTDYDYLVEQLDNHFEEQAIRPIAIISGGAGGADTLAEQYADRRGIEKDIHKAHWKHQGAGLERNKDMVHAADYVIAFWDGSSPGTKQAIDYSTSVGKHPHIILV